MGEWVVGYTVIFHWYQAPVVQRVDSTIHWITQLILRALIGWIEIYSVNSTIHPSNNWGQVSLKKWWNCWWPLTSSFVENNSLNITCNPVKVDAWSIFYILWKSQFSQIKRQTIPVNKNFIFIQRNVGVQTTRYIIIHLTWCSGIQNNIESGWNKRYLSAKKWHRNELNLLPLRQLLSCAEKNIFQIVEFTEFKAQTLKEFQRLCHLHHLLLILLCLLSWHKTHHQSTRNPLLLVWSSQTLELVSVAW